MTGDNIWVHCYEDMAKLNTRDTNAFFEKMEEKGISKEELNKVYTPIGLDLGGESPEEIAVSIIAEILMIKNGRTGTHWTGKEK